MVDREVFDVWKVREDFPMLKKAMNGKSLVYLDTAATALKPRCVIEGVHAYYEHEYGTVHRAVYELAAHATEMYSAVREKVRRFLGAKEEEEIIFTKGTTESINLVAYSFGRAFVGEGDEIIITEMEHHSNIVPWQILCKEKKAVLKVIPVDAQGTLILEEYEKLLSNKTKLVSLAHASNAAGTINPVKQIIEKAHNFGVKVMLDGAQAAPHFPLNVQELDVDFYAFSGHKIYAPTGTGVLYGKRELLEAMPPFLSGGDMIDSVTLEKATFQPPPLKFEAGTPNIAGIIGLGLAIDYIESLGKKAIMQWEQKLCAHAMEKLQEIKGMRIIGAAQEKGPVISFSIQGLHPLDLGTILGLKGIAMRTGHLCAQPLLKRFEVEALSRISFGVYTTHEDIDLFIHALQESAILLMPAMLY